MVLKNVLLIFYQSKRYIAKNKYKKHTITQKTLSQFGFIALLKSDRYIFCLYNNHHNHEDILPGKRLTNQKLAEIKRIFENISNNTKVDVFSEKTLIDICLTQDFKIFFSKIQKSITGNKDLSKFF